VKVLRLGLHFPAPAREVVLSLGAGADVDRLLTGEDKFPNPATVERASDPRQIAVPPPGRTLVVAGAGTGRFEQPMPTIHQRPFRPRTARRCGTGWGDFIIGKGQQSAIGTLVERQTRTVRRLQREHEPASAGLLSEKALTSAPTPDTCSLARTNDRPRLIHDDLMPAEPFEPLLPVRVARLTRTRLAAKASVLGLPLTSAGWSAGKEAAAVAGATISVPKFDS
jgi:hypothetical protein